MTGRMPFTVLSNCGTVGFLKEHMKIDAHITAVIDRSGSMAHLTTDTIGGFNKFLEDQKAVPGAAVFSLYLFNHAVHPIYSNVPIEDIDPLTPEVYNASGNTAYLDALGRAIGETGDYLKSLPDDERPSVIVVLVMTDGEENSSGEYSLSQIRTLVEQQEQQWGWKFLFLGANLDATLEGGRMGIAASNAVAYNASGKSVRSALDATSRNLAGYRVSQDSTALDYTPEQRATIVADDDDKSKD